MDTTPYWQNGKPFKHYPRLSRNLKVDVVVVGAGVTGITAAYLLKKQGATVALLERQRCMQADTGHTSAHLTHVTDRRLQTLADKFGKDKARAVWEAGALAIDLIEHNIRDLGLACEFKRIPGFLHVALKSKDFASDVRELKREAKLAATLGFDATFLNEVPFMRRPGVHFANQAKYHPHKYLSGLLKTVAGKGSHIFENTAVEEVKDDPLRVVTPAGTVQCAWVVIATNVPLQGKNNLAEATLFQSRLIPYTSYVVSGKTKCGEIPEASFWDTTDPYYYLRVDRKRDHDYVIFGGQDHKTGQTKDTAQRYQRVEYLLRQMVPDIRIDHRWSGQVVDNTDGMPLIGEIAPKQFVATGFCGNGMTFGTVAALMACDHFAGRKNPWRELFDPNRKILKGGAWNYLKECADYPYYLIRDRLAKAGGNSVRSLRRNEGKILNLRGQKVAAYRNDKGYVTRCSAICPHLWCLVDWNKAECTWDCPCHGSRFSPTGKVLAGPAETDLSKIK